jgi:hypothetical protein
MIRVTRQRDVALISSVEAILKKHDRIMIQVDLYNQLQLSSVQQLPSFKEFSRILLKMRGVVVTVRRYQRF